MVAGIPGGSTKTVLAFSNAVAKPAIAFCTGVWGMAPAGVIRDLGTHVQAGRAEPRDVPSA